jgi:hypothetical protein
MIRLFAKKQSGYRRVLRKVWMGLGGAAVTLLFQACYGMPADTGEDYPISGRVLSKTTSQPIPGIKVTVKELSITDQTDSDGSFWLHLPFNGDCELVFEDVDGEENGGVFVSETIPVAADGLRELEVSLTPSN